MYGQCQLRPGEAQPALGTGRQGQDLLPQGQPLLSILRQHQVCGKSCQNFISLKMLNSFEKVCLNSTTLLSFCFLLAQLYVWRTKSELFWTFQYVMMYVYQIHQNCQTFYIRLCMQLLYQTRKSLEYISLTGSS